MLENQKKIWITGASSGIGKALAEKFTKEGWKVAISARRKEILNQIADNKNIFSFPLDVTIEEDCKKRDEMVFEFSKKCEAPIITVMGGGYSEKIYDIVEAHCNTFKGMLSLF